MTGHELRMAGYLILFCLLLNPSGLYGQQSGLNYGYLSVNATNTDSVFVVIDLNFESPFHVSNGDSLLLEAGEYSVRVVQKFFRDSENQVTIHAGETTNITLDLLAFTEKNKDHVKKLSTYPRIFWGQPVVIRSDPEAEIAIEGDYQGDSYVITDSLNHETVTIRGYGREKTRRIQSPAESHFEVVDFHILPSKGTSYALSVIPGASQIYNRQRLKGAGVLLAQSLLIYGSASANDSYTNTNDKYNETLRQYSLETDPDRVLELGNEAELLRTDIGRYYNIRNGLIIASGAMYLYNLLDVFFLSEKRYREKTFDPYLDFTNGGQIGLKYIIN